MIDACILGLSVLCFYMEFMARCERRTNLVEINDPLFEWLPICDTSLPIGIILWFCTLFFFANWPLWDQELTIWCFIILMISRSFVLYTHPFLGHHTMIPLRDVFIEWVTGTDQEPLRSDMSFSGHCSTLFALGLLLRPYYTFYFVATILTAILLVLSRVHYTADCLIAPIFAYWAFMMAPELMVFWHTHVSIIVTVLLSMGFLSFSALPRIACKHTVFSSHSSCARCLQKPFTNASSSSESTTGSGT